MLAMIAMLASSLINIFLDCMGYLAKLNYYSMNPIGWNELNLKTNTTGADYTDKSVQREYSAPIISRILAA